MNLSDFQLLPRFVTDYPLLATLTLVGVGAVCSLIVEHLASTLDVGRYGWQRRLRARLGVDPGKHIQELRWLTLSYQFVVWPFIAFLLLHVWGQHEVGERVSDVLAGKGFSLRGLRIVPAQILFGVVWFVLLVSFTRWLKAKLEDDWLPLSALDPSVRVSVATVFGYITFIVAAMVGLSVAGLDLSKLAIVAGALSVGIGFGLQNIFNNFVSGLILLFERPVRLGDYIKVGKAEGFVRRIRIRATELETWDHTTIIVPNSELLGGEVENSTYGNTLGRVILPVAVAYNTDPELVRELLLQAAQQCESFIKNGEAQGIPPPFVLFKAFGDSALEFQLRGYVDNVNAKLIVASELRFAVLRLFREHGVQMPFPQRDVWLRSATPGPAPKAGSPVKAPEFHAGDADGGR